MSSGDITSLQHNSIKNLLRSTILSSKRHGSWFRLSLQERGICTLSMRLNVTFKSVKLVKVLLSIIRKLQESGTLLSRFARGTVLAWAFSLAAESWGNPSAAEWRSDEDYIRYLGSKFGGGGRG